MVSGASGEQADDMGVSENRGPSKSTLDSTVLIIRTPK